MLQRRLYVRNTYKFKLGIRYALLEPMDIVLLTDSALGLGGAAVRITQIEEDENGELTVAAEEIPGVTPRPARSPRSASAPRCSTPSRPLPVPRSIRSSIPATPTRRSSSSRPPG